MMADLKVRMQAHERRPMARVECWRLASRSALEYQACAHAAYERCGVSSVGEIDVGDVIWTKDSQMKLMAQGLAEEAKALIGDVLRSKGIDQAKWVTDRPDFLCCRGARFHNDVFGLWPSSLFWVLVLEASDAELVIPGIGVRQLLEPGVLVLFDPSLPHAVCRPGDDGRFKDESFGGALVGSDQAFLSGEISLEVEDWERIGCEPVAVAEGVAGGLSGIDLVKANSFIDCSTGCILDGCS